MTARLTRAGQATFTALAIVLSLSLSGPASASGGTVNQADDQPPNDRIVIDVVAVNGSGCPAGTADVAVSPDNTAFTVTYSDYVARVGGNADPVDFRKNCQLAVLIHIPQGFTYAIAQADYRGSARLRTGAVALQRANYYFQGSSDAVHLDHSLTGPFNDSWHTTDVTPVTELVFAPCGRSTILNINTELRVHAASSAPNASSFITMSTTDGRVNTTHHFHWLQCG